MKPERWEQVKALHTLALEKPQHERASFVARSCGDDDELAHEVMRLLDGVSNLGSFLEPPNESASEPFRPASFNFRGSMFGEYELVTELGRGATGIVYRAHQASLGRDAAVKILSAHAAGSPERRERFVREALAASKVRHANVVSIYACAEQDGVPYIAMEHVAGQGLHEAISRRREERARAVDVVDAAGLAVDDPLVAARICAKVALGLESCREKSVIHRDVKPQNILVDERGEPRIVDFGLARDDSLDALTLTGALAGTLHYMSPEQAAMSGRAVDHRTDVYSLGVVLYEMLTLEPPFGGLSPVDVLDAVQHRTPQLVELLNPRVPSALAAICAHAMEKRPADRYATAGEFAADLERFLAGEAVRAPKPTVVHRVWRSAVHHRRWIAAASLFALVSLSVALAPQLSRSHASDLRDEAATPQALEIYDDLLRRADQAIRTYEPTSREEVEAPGAHSSRGGDAGTGEDTELHGRGPDNPPAREPSLPKTDRAPGAGDGPVNGQPGGEVIRELQRRLPHDPNPRKAKED